MPYTDVTYPTTASTSIGTGDIDWTNASNIRANDDTYATCALIAGESTYELQATNFGFTLSNTSVINRISVRAKVKQGTGEELQFKEVKLLYNGAVVGDTYKAGAFIYEEELIFSISEGMWETYLRYSEINDSSFGVAISFEGRDGAAVGTVSVNYITVDLAYSEDNQLSDIRDLSVDSIVELYQIDFTPIGYAQQLYITPYTDGQGAAVTFNGIAYQPIPMSATGFGWDGKGALPTPTIVLSNALNTFSEINITYGNLLGVEIKRIQTFRRYLDTGASPDPFATLPIDVYYIAQKVNQNEVTVEYKLASIVDLEGVMLPRGKYYRDSCIYQYRRPLKNINGEFISFDYGIRTTCPYAGDAYFDINGDSVQSPLEDTCSYRLETGCIKRFGEVNPLPIKAFPGLSDKPS
jgi:lambda family phage minor tail protein L